MNFFKKNILVCLQLIIVLLLMSMISAAGGLQDMSRINKIRGASKKTTGAAAEPTVILSSTSFASSSTLYNSRQSISSAGRPSPSFSSSSLSSAFQGSSSPIFDQNQQQQFPPPPGFINESPAISHDLEVTRIYRLYNRRSSGDLLIRDDNKVSATGSNTDVQGDLGLESVIKENVVRTRIYGISNGKYLCFKKKGRLVLKPKSKARGDKCEFIEETTESGSRFSSVLNPRWHIGFTTKGSPLNGAAYDPNQSATFACPSCFLFLKTSSVHKDKYPTNLTQNNFDPVGHNKGIGQIHPGLEADEFLSEFQFPTKASPLLPQTTTQKSSSSRAGKHRHRHPHRRRRLQKKKKAQEQTNNLGVISTTEKTTESPIEIRNTTTTTTTDRSASFKSNSISRQNVISNGNGTDDGRLSYEPVSRRNSSQETSSYENSSNYAPTRSPHNSHSKGNRHSKYIYNSNNNNNNKDGNTGSQWKYDNDEKVIVGNGFQQLPSLSSFLSTFPLISPSSELPATKPVNSQTTTISPPSRNSQSSPKRLKKSHRKPNNSTTSSGGSRSSNNNNNKNSRRPVNNDPTTTTSTSSTTTTTPSPEPTTTKPLISFSRSLYPHHRRRHHHHRHYPITSLNSTASLITSHDTLPPTLSKFPRMNSSR